MRVESLDVPQPAFRINDSALLIMRKCLDHLSEFYSNFRFEERPTGLFMSRFVCFPENDRRLKGKSKCGRGTAECSYSIPRKSICGIKYL